MPLEASLRPATILTLARWARVPLGVESEGELRGHTVARTPSVRTALRARWSDLLASREAVELAVRDLLAEMAMQNVVHAEVVLPSKPLGEHAALLDALPDIVNGLREEASERRVTLAFLVGLDLASTGSHPPEPRDRAVLDRIAWSGIVVEDSAPSTSASAARVEEALELLAGVPLAVVVGAGATLDAIAAALADRRPRRVLSRSTGGRVADSPPPLVVECPAADRLAGFAPLPNGAPVSSGGGPLHDTNLTRELLRAVAASEDPRRELVARCRASVEAATLDEDVRARVLGVLASD